MTDASRHAAGRPGPDPGAEAAARVSEDADSSLSYEEARAELAKVVERLESGGGTLEESLALWERGEYLAGVCQRWLDGARARLDAARGTTGAAEDDRGPEMRQ